jgi:hypothetical protein
MRRHTLLKLWVTKWTYKLFIYITGSQTALIILFVCFLIVSFYILKRLPRKILPF